MTQLAGQVRATLLDYFVTPSRAYLFVTLPGSACASGDDTRSRGRPPARDAAEFGAELASHDLAFRRPRHGSSNRPSSSSAERDLGRSRAVVVIPDGPLWDVPFQALEVRPGHFFIEDRSISDAPRSLVLERRSGSRGRRVRSPASGGLLAFGDPGAGNAPSGKPSVRVRENPQACTVPGKAMSSRVKRRPKVASRQRPPAIALPHLASHATLDDVNPMYSHGLLARRGVDDGQLEARELMNLKLKAELLVLSACETARGEASSGEGITGMLWAAFAAGAPTTVASLWRVESASTSELMIEFHRQWLASRWKACRSRRPRPSAQRRASSSPPAAGRSVLLGRLQSPEARDDGRDWPKGGRCSSWRLRP